MPQIEERTCNFLASEVSKICNEMRSFLRWPSHLRKVDGTHGNFSGNFFFELFSTLRVEAHEETRIIERSLLARYRVTFILVEKLQKNGQERFSHVTKKICFYSTVNCTVGTGLFPCFRRYLYQYFL